ncbi:MAG: hypothetical protein ABSE20_30600 [Acetobacteraceae bacterium]|jgi:hypothetical protein
MSISIAARLAGLEADGTVVLYRPVSRYPARRRLYLAERAIRDFNDRGPAVNVLVGAGAIAAAMTRWVAGGLVYGNGKRGLFLDRLEPPPPEVWEIRVIEHNPEARLFGRFVEPDTLVLTAFHTRGHLGKKTSRAWLDAMTACVSSWERLFPGLPPFTGYTIHDYVSENYHDFPI